MRAAVFCIELYRTYISPMRPPTCRFTPTCSEYAVEALRDWGLLRGLALAMWRLLKCGPWHRGGWDPVPQRRHDRNNASEELDVERLEASSESLGVATASSAPTDQHS
ncbi:membrane protein insertion efficiency factor YidD [Tomitella biformata]|uniref:membrane protein insertion efficiency factor YidD n=1 Tax=Tomitella biformata TaxID=630403 RepID=UPI000A011637|nr:membrane protein insertion efficiency factor YidD [Tomitella biformata]